MTCIRKALARGVQLHGAVLALAGLVHAAADHLVSVCGVVQDVPPIAKKRCWVGEWVQVSRQVL